MESKKIGKSYEIRPIKGSISSLITPEGLRHLVRRPGPPKISLENTSKIVKIDIKEIQISKLRIIRNRQPRTRSQANNCTDQKPFKVKISAS